MSYFNAHIIYVTNPLEKHQLLLFSSVFYLVFCVTPTTKKERKSQLTTVLDEKPPLSSPSEFSAPAASPVFHTHTAPAGVPSYLGRHLLAEFYGCDANILNNVQRIEEIMCEAAVECGATIVQQNFHMFNPYGVSGVVIIAESHLAIHTWPEHGYAAVDLFTCGDNCDPKVAYDYVCKHLFANSAVYSELSRGMMNPDTDEMIQAPFQVKTQVTHYAAQSIRRAEAGAAT